MNDTVKRAADSLIMKALDAKERPTIMIIPVWPSRRNNVHAAVPDDPMGRPAFRSGFEATGRRVSTALSSPATVPGVFFRGCVRLGMGMLLLLSLLVFLVPTADAQPRGIRVGVYQNKPGVFYTATNKAQGFYVDILEYVATEEQWRIDYVFGSWSRLLEHLADGEIDLVVAIAHTEERDKTFDFNRETALANWGQVYVRDGAIQSLINLEHRRVAGLESDVYTLSLKKLLKSLDIPHTFIEVPQYSDAMELVALGRADAAIVSRTSGLVLEQEYPLIRSPIICCPVEVRYAVAGGRNQDLILALDLHLKRLKDDKDSIYFKSMDKWFGNIRPREPLPSWLRWSFAIVFLLLLLFIVGNLWLRREVRLRTRELLAAKVAAEEASKVKSEFLANMSHEIRTPLNAVIGMTDLVLDMHLEREQKSYLEIVLSSAEALLALLNSILDFSKIEAGRMELENILFPLKDPVGSACDTLAVNAHRKELEIYLDIDPGVPEMMRGDPFRLRQILVNLINNAIKFTKHGEIVLEITSVPSSGPSRSSITFAVRDTGIGIPGEKLEKIFDSFTQADGSTSRKYGGTGLGLTISRQLVELMGGVLEVESEEGKGSRFFFTLDCETAPHMEGTNRQPLQGMNILVADILETNRRLVAGVLSRLGARVTVECDGDAAWRAMSESPGSPGSGGAEDWEDTGFDVFVIGHKLWNGADGSTLCGHLGSRSDLCEKTVAMLPAHRRKNDPHLERGPHVGAMLVKPAHAERLLDTLQSMPLLGLLPDRPVGQRSRGEGKAGGNTYHILVVEDEPNNQKLVTDILDQAGHTWSLAGDGLVALERIEAEVFDLVLMDIMLPGMDGYEVTRAIRNRGADPVGTASSVPVIGITAHVLKGDRNKCLNAGMNGFLAKPFRPRDLLSVLYRMDKQLTQKKVLRKKSSQVKIIKLNFIGSPEYHATRVVVFTQWPRIMTRLYNAIEAGDMTVVATNAEEMKGVSHGIGADLVRNEAFKLAIATRNSSATRQVREQFVELEREYLKAVMVMVMAESDRLSGDDRDLPSR
ncbi:MAG: response regulator [Magnetococcales bacterium]|nr:response regulator [Magnetococcales bacterium]